MYFYVLQSIHFPEHRCLGHLWENNKEQTACNRPEKLQFMVRLNLNPHKGGRHCLAKHCYSRWRRESRGQGEDWHTDTCPPTYTLISCVIIQSHIFQGYQEVLIPGWFYSPAGGRGSEGCTWDWFKLVIITEKALGVSSFIPHYDQTHLSIPSCLDPFFTFPLFSFIANIVQTQHFSFILFPYPFSWP